MAARSSLCLLLCLGLSACTTAKDSGAEAAAPLSDPSTGLAADPACEDFQGTAIPGATSYFVGTFDFDGSTVTGEERWLLFANDAWRAHGEDDCVVTWSVTGEQVAPSSGCGSCSYGLSVSAGVDASLTDCPEALYEGVEQFTTQYDVKAADGSATVYFPSGSVLGTGAESTSGVTYRSEGSCLYF
ncbi:MAG: hypothetical protein ACI8S6_000084 [Myxococcota bacterium]|jgi:hypothetical protein